MPRLTLYGMYQYDNTLFDGITLPDGLDKEILIADIISTSGDLYPYYQVAPVLKTNISLWFKRRKFDFTQLYNALRADYSPIENYNRIETRKQSDEESGNDTNSRHGSESTNENGTATSERGTSAFDKTSYANRDRTQDNSENKMVNNSNSTLITNYGKRNDSTEEVYIHGNIGVTTNQEMIEAEIKLRTQFDIFRVITQEFEREFLVQVY